ncbi:MAG: hypothetical protein RLZZ28_976 [Bacteroidota bacterium]|jgi:hypothetical protein
MQLFGIIVQLRTPVGGLFSGDLLLKIKSGRLPAIIKTRACYY